MLTPEQITAFKRDGFVILPKFIAQDQLNTWRSTFWQAIGASPDDPQSWPGDWDKYNPAAEPSQKGHPGLRLSDYPPVVEIADQLMGAHQWRRGLRPPNPRFGETQLWKEDDLLQAKWPEPDRGGVWEPPAGGHIDGGNTSKDGWKGGFMLGAITCLEDTVAGGGCFYYWPGSHLAVHSFLKAKPEFINPNEYSHPFGSTEALDRESPSGYSEQPREWVAEAGDVILWHHWLMHNGSMNVRNFPRLGLFARWHHKDWSVIKYDKGGIRSDGDLWKYWSEEVKQQQPPQAPAAAKL